MQVRWNAILAHFYSRPCGRGDIPERWFRFKMANFYSRPCGRGDYGFPHGLTGDAIFLLTPLREGRRRWCEDQRQRHRISTHAPAGGATEHADAEIRRAKFLLTPLREGRPGRLRDSITYEDFYSRPCGRGDKPTRRRGRFFSDFYSRPCGRGDLVPWCPVVVGPCISTHAPAGGATQIGAEHPALAFIQFLLTPLREGRLTSSDGIAASIRISTHAPAGGATAGAGLEAPARQAFLLTPLREGRRQFSTSPS